MVPLPTDPVNIREVYEAVVSARREERGTMELVASVYHSREHLITQSEPKFESRSDTLTVKPSVIAEPSMNEDTTLQKRYYLWST